MPGRDGLLVLAASEGMPRGVARAGHARHRLRGPGAPRLRASVPGCLGSLALRDDGAAVRRRCGLGNAQGCPRSRRRAGASRCRGSRRATRPELSAHFDAMLEANGLRDVRRFVIPETTITDAQLPAEVAAPVRDWLTDTAQARGPAGGGADPDDVRRAGHVPQPGASAGRSGGGADRALARAAATRLTPPIRRAWPSSTRPTRDGSLLRGEVLARWQDFAGTGDLLRTLQVAPGPGRQAEEAAHAGQGGRSSSGAASQHGVADHGDCRPGRRARRGGLAAAAGRAALLAGMERQAAAAATAPRDRDGIRRHSAGRPRASSAGAGAGPAGWARPHWPGRPPGWPQRAAGAIASWQEHVLHLVREENVTKRSIARVVSFDEESLALVLTIGVLGYAAADAAADGSGAGAVAAAAADVAVRGRAAPRHRRAGPAGPARAGSAPVRSSRPGGSS